MSDEPVCQIAGCDQSVVENDDFCLACAAQQGVALDALSRFRKAMFAVPRDRDLLRASIRDGVLKWRYLPDELSNQVTSAEAELQSSLRAVGLNSVAERDHWIIQLTADV